MASAFPESSGSGSSNDVAKEAVSEETLGSMFLRGLELHDKVRDSGDDPRSDAFQNEVRKAILLLEDATRMVSVLDLFSRNEDVSEVTTHSLKFFLLPALLGNLNSKLQEDHERRLEVIRVVETYYMDFLRRIKDYGIVDYALPDVKPDEDDADGSDAAPPVAAAASRQVPDLRKMEGERELKMRRFKEKKQLESEIKELRFAVTNEDEKDDETLRKFYLALIKGSALECLEELASFQMEKPILAHMAKVKRGEVKAVEVRRSTRPLKPIIITKDMVQKEVFGMGYKNLPVLSIEEFYEQRVRDGWFPDPAQVKQQQSLMDRANQDPEAALAQQDEEERVNDDKEDRDDEEELQRKRNWDEYTDEHKRGEGNMHNKG